VVFTEVLTGVNYGCGDGCAHVLAAIATEGALRPLHGSPEGG